MQLHHQLFNILLALGAFLTGATDGACDPQKAAIVGGNYTWLVEEKTIKYECPDGKYPHPAEIRMCHGSRWNLMRDAQKRPVSKARCRDIRCARPLEFENGLYEPRQPYYNVSQELRFECYQGYTLRGSQNRTCLPHGKWSGQTTTCDDGAGHCPNPGIPIGSLKEGRRYRIEDQVRYHCENGLSLMGSKSRVCQESGAWTGTEPECRNPFTYDTPEEVSSQFISSLTEVAESSDPDKVVSDTEKRRIKITPDGSMNIYILLDASQSVGKKNFNEAKDVINKLIEKVSSYDVTPNYAVVTFATKPKVIVSTINQQSNNAAWVIDQLEKLRHEDHALQPGTNMKAGLSSVYEMMVNQQEDEKRKQLDPLPIITTTRHVIILLTDGNFNMGGEPVPVIAQIREFLYIGRDRTVDREDYLDVYVFGVGEMVNVENVNELASKKTNEKHVFKLNGLEDMQKAFDEMIDESEALSMCGLAKEYESANDGEKNPWLVSISILRPGRGTEMCKGTLISDKSVLTAAHCFTIDDTADDIKVKIGKKTFTVAALKSHPQYSVGKLRNLGIPEFYDYDVALVTLRDKVTLSAEARPICLPCTAGTTRALRRPHPQTTCREHEEELMSVGNIPALFVTPCHVKDSPGLGLRRRTVRIKYGDQKHLCEEDAKKAKQYQNVTEASQVVTERFLCTGGAEPEVDPNTCKGDSGGPLIIAKRMRYIQVGVISWGVVDVCKNKAPSYCDQSRDIFEHAPDHARDFHINIFKILPWLRLELHEEGLDFIH
ncbi:complement factor B [Paroedura picta]|uniref:complement factor B n=1 Tax=Paroedura picta TaxID=143630 RepID=UPI0040561FFF